MTRVAEIISLLYCSCLFHDPVQASFHNSHKPNHHRINAQDTSTTTTTSPPRRRRTCRQRSFPAAFSSSASPSMLLLVAVLLLLLRLEGTTAFTPAGPGACLGKGTTPSRSPSMMAAPSNDEQIQPSTHRRTSSRSAIPREQHLRAAGLFAAVAGLTFAAPRVTHARREPLGVIDELLAECPSEKSCASSQDDRPPVFQEPWQYDDSTQAKAMRRLKGYVEGMPGVEVITAEEGYLRADLTEKGVVNELEFFFTPNDSIIQFRAARRGEGDDKGANQKRMEAMRIKLGFEKIPVLRNRQRALFFLESPLDKFGPVYGQNAPTPEDLQAAYKDNDPKAPEWGNPSPYPSFLQGGSFLRQEERAKISN